MCCTMIYTTFGSNQCTRFQIRAPKDTYTSHLKRAGISKYIPGMPISGNIQKSQTEMAPATLVLICAFNQASFRQWCTQWCVFDVALSVWSRKCNEVNTNSSTQMYFILRNLLRKLLEKEMSAYYGRTFIRLHSIMELVANGLTNIYTSAIKNIYPQTSNRLKHFDFLKSKTHAMPLCYGIKLYKSTQLPL